ncbi:hypothetical protein D7231_05620 [Streptomyces klenkii]|uniref:Uncharacterized protein n=1 Tax=Streptomyces klenkii TaxID=1420899 RepID=A0A3B0BVU9_9ACTN|nr:hypothetical protein [Streptomyces klenkii]RKN76468.1 hypothetical protein D7231_05620 [Streptomyces klenkii]
MSGQQQVEDGVAPGGSSGQAVDMSKWCLRCAQLRVRFHGAWRLGRTEEAMALDAEFVRHQQVVHS